MEVFKNFLQTYKNGFLLHNCYESIEYFLEKAKDGNFLLEEENKNYFFYNNKALFFFLNEYKKFFLKNSYIRILGKNENYFLKYKNFLQLNNFRPYHFLQQMTLKNKQPTLNTYDFIQKPQKHDLDDIYNFFISFFDNKYLFCFSKKDLLIHLDNILIYKENNTICGGLFYSRMLNNAVLEFIAVKPNLKYKNVAYALLCHFFKENENVNFYKLFADKKNSKAINFYTRSGFTFTETQARFYRNF
ncbi:GNAT family N-acetyltransferase [Campylobacter lari]|uniref:GNAT family N-acetyltransferase n=1 Tax=Campylobacter lari TaxID=201 RepID=UPI0011EAF00C|nr:GNAT family N-acetyltransferase [Campylobacter lari]EAK5748242.1 GNAT family N-acetyltransferase [Campylobacter lari]KAB0589821.1 GNAT family N-acetyltransferase [Campylobacter lari subsp. concheus]MPC01051.1 GNAT family N-acetyltransferase [Campylobacter lari]QEL07329.1 acetyltransferase [Campylobacter lari subsp. concheus]